MDSLGKMLPPILLPYAQQWAERSGLPLLAQLLVDEQFRSLLEKYGDEMVRRMAQGGHLPANGDGHANGMNSHANGMNGHANGIKPTFRTEPFLDEADAKESVVADLQDRLLAMQAQQEAQQALFELLRSRIRPLALALGCCPECLVGVVGCPKCWGQSKVGHYPPDLRLLETVVVNPLAARGAPLILNEEKSSGAGASERETPNGWRPEVQPQ
jgi:hypothetical protein